MINTIFKNKITNIPFYLFIVISFVIVVSKRLPSKTMKSESSFGLKKEIGCQKICNYLYNCLNENIQNVDIESKAKGFHSGCYDGCIKHIHKLDNCAYDVNQTCKDYGKCFKKSLGKYSLK